jgi:5-methylcytosine-specific restriction endonuclease McrA
MKTIFKVLHEKALQITKSYLKAESDLISVLQEIDDCRGYREIGFKSLFEYATQSLGLSESVSYNLITIARKSKEVPQLQEMIRSQVISVSNARMIAPVLTEDNQERWLSSAAKLSKRELEKEIAQEFPERLVQERARYVSEKRIELKMGISEDVHEMLKRVQDLVSSQIGNAATLEETLRVALELYIEKKDPMEKARRVERRHAHLSQAKSDKAEMEPVPGQVKSNPRFIPARIEHAVRLRDHGKCTHRTSQGTPCNERRWLDVHHVKPLSEGGLTHLDNLTLICRGHHQMLHHAPLQLPNQWSQPISKFRFG